MSGSRSQRQTRPFGRSGKFLAEKAKTLIIPERYENLTAFLEYKMAYNYKRMPKTYYCWQKVYAARCCCHQMEIRIIG
jgi:hypothetical protein